MKAPESILPSAADRAEIDSFCDTLWLEDGLAKASLASYRSDLLRLAGWLAEQHLGTLCNASDVALSRFVATLSQTLRASSQARYISTLRRFYRHLLARGRIERCRLAEVEIEELARRVRRTRTGLGEACLEARELLRGEQRFLRPGTRRAHRGPAARRRASR